MNIARCSSCGAEIVWLMTNAHKKMPINADFMAEIVDDIHADPAPIFNYADHQKGVHWQSCPHADQHRRKR